jgi:hypothetical protein
MLGLRCCWCWCNTISTWTPLPKFIIIFVNHFRSLNCILTPQKFCLCLSQTWLQWKKIY